MEPSQPGKRGENFRVFIWETLPQQPGRFHVSRTRRNRKYKHDDSANTGLLLDLQLFCR